MNPLLRLNKTLDESFEKKLFNPFNFQQTTDDEANDPDLNIFNDHSEAVSLPYYTIDEFSCPSNSLLKNPFSILQINIRSMNKKFEKLQEYLNVVKGKFSIIALTETWCNDDRADKTLYGKCPTTHLFTKLDKMDKKDGVLLYLCTITLILR